MGISGGTKCGEPRKRTEWENAKLKWKGCRCCGGRVDLRVNPEGIQTGNGPDEVETGVKIIRSSESPPEEHHWTHAEVRR